MQIAKLFSSLIPFLFIGGCLSLMGLIWLISAHYARKRRQGFEQLAEALGFLFTAKTAPEILIGIPQFKLLQTGRRQRIENLLSGSSETTQVMIFDWLYVTGSGKNTQNHTSTLVAIQSAEFRLPLFLCRPESVLDWIGLTFDGKDIDIESEPLFSKKYHLHGNNESRIRGLFDSAVCTFFTQHEKSYVEASGQWLIYCRKDHKVAPDKVRQLLADAFELHVLLKETPDDEARSGVDSQPAISDQARDEMPPEAEREF